MSIDASSPSSPFILEASEIKARAEALAGKERSFELKFSREGAKAPSTINLEMREARPSGFLEKKKWVSLNVRLQGRQQILWVKIEELAQKLGTSQKSIKKAAKAHELEHWIAAAGPYQKMKEQFFTRALTKDQIRKICKIIQSGAVIKLANQFFAKLEQEEKEAKVRSAAKPTFEHQLRSIPVTIRVNADREIYISLIGTPREKPGRLGKGSYKVVHRGVKYDSAEAVASAMAKAEKDYQMSLPSLFDDDTSVSKSKPSTILIPLGQSTRVKVHSKMRRGLDYMQREVAMHTACNDIEEVVKLKNFFYLPKTPASGKGGSAPVLAHGIDLEFCDGGTLATYLADAPGGRDISDEDRLDVFIGILSGVSKINARGIIHSDLKPSNILLKTVKGADGRARKEIRISDFGMAFRQGEKHIGSTHLYESPEPKDQRTNKIDAWALGILGLELFSGHQIFKSICSSSEKNKVDIRKLTKELVKLSRSKPDIAEILSQLLVVDPAKRLSAEQALKLAHALRKKKDEG